MGGSTSIGGGGVVLALPGNERLAAALAEGLGRTLAEREIRRFPDGETYVRVDTPVEGRDVTLVCSLDQADVRLPGLLLTAATVRDLGAATVRLVAPYLGYMRQDDRFRPGEGITSLYVGRLLSAVFDHLVTIDPHLHRHEALGDVYSVAHATVTAAPALGEWVRAHVPDALLVGPDAESEQWVRAAARHDLPFVVFTKTRLGDRDVEIRAPDLTPYQGRTPVLVDDVLSTGRTMAEAARLLSSAGFAAPVCTAVHAVFSDGAEHALAAAGIETVVTCDTIAHGTNAIEVAPLLVDALQP
jgi:ribose-phosphate pyrophosphokinase